MTLKGLHPSLNHKRDFWFSPQNPRNQWGVLTVEAAKYEDGAIEAILKVPKTAVCPICDGAPMTNLIDNHRIVNVSLEGECVGGVCYDGSCEGFTFTDPPFTLLTTDVLPGIPLARIKPLEAYLPWSQSSHHREAGKRRKMNKKKKPKRTIRVKPTIIEEHDPAKMGLASPDTPMRHDTNVYREPETSTTQGPTGTRFRGNMQNVSQQTNVAKGTDPAHSKPEGVWSYSRREAITGTPLKISTKDEPTLIKPADPMPKPVDAPLKPTGKISPDLTTTELPSSDKPAPEPAMQPTAPGKIAPHPPHECPKGHHWNTEDGRCDPDEVSLVSDVPAGGSSAPLGESDTIPATPVVADPEHGCPTGSHWSVEAGKCVPDTTEQVVHDCPEGQEWNAELGMCVDSHKGAVEEPQEQHQCPPGLVWDDVAGKCVSDDITKAEQEAGDCPDGYHWDAEAGKCVEDEPITERVRRIQAEYRAAKAERNIGLIEATWVNKYSQLDKDLRSEKAMRLHHERIMREQRSALKNEGLRVEDLRVEMRDVKNQYADAIRMRDKYARLVEDLKIEAEDLKKKYHGALSTNLSLSKKITSTNEEYLMLAKRTDILEGKLSKARVNAKKTLKLKV